MNIKFFINTHKEKDALEKTVTLRYDDKIEGLYQEYIKKIPLDLEDLPNNVKLKNWNKNNLLSKIDISRKIFCLQNSKTLDEFIKKSDADFDNLAPILELAVKRNIIKVLKSGQIRKIFNFNFSQLKNNAVKKNKLRFIPDSGLNQFPCDSDSRVRRKDFLKSRYPFAKYLKFAIIGDDDFVSTEFVNDSWAYPVIVEKDKRILDIIKMISSRFELVERDISEFLKFNDFPCVQSFITDPPYTLHGSLAFIYAGLRMLNSNQETKEFYVVLNSTMMGKNFFQMQRILSESRVFLVGVIDNFSQYKLPDDFNERKRANKFLSKMDVKDEFLKYSSSSSLYIFKTVLPDIRNLEAKIKFNKLYEHYL